MNIFSKQHIDQNRHQRQGRDQGSQQGETQRIGQRGKHFSFYLLKCKNGKQPGHDNELGKKNGFPQFRSFIFD